jgi:hypothetical protein
VAMELDGVQTTRQVRFFPASQYQSNACVDYYGKCISTIRLAKRLGHMILTSRVAQFRIGRCLWSLWDLRGSRMAWSLSELIQDKTVMLNADWNSTDGNIWMAVYGSSRVSKSPKPPPFLATKKLTRCQWFSILQACTSGMSSFLQKQ